MERKKKPSNDLFFCLETRHWQDRHFVLCGDLLEWFVSSEAPSPQKAISISARTSVTVEDGSNGSNSDASTADGFEFTIVHKPVGKSWKLRAKTERARKIWIRALSLAGAQVPPEFAADEAEAAEYRALTSEYLNELNHQSDRQAAPGAGAAAAAAERQRIEAEVAREDGVTVDSGRRETRMQRSLTSLLINSNAGKSLQQSGRESKAAAVLPFACSHCQPAVRYPTQMQLDAHVRSVHTSHGEVSPSPQPTPATAPIAPQPQKSPSGNQIAPRPLSPQPVPASPQPQPQQQAKPAAVPSSVSSQQAKPAPAAAATVQPQQQQKPAVVQQQASGHVPASPARPQSPGVAATPASPARPTSPRPVPAVPSGRPQPQPPRPVSSTTIPVPSATAPAPPRPQSPPAKSLVQQQPPAVLTLSPEPDDSDREVPPAPDTPPPSTPPLQPPSTPGSVRYDANGVAIMKVPQRFAGAMSQRGPPQSPGRLAGAPVPRGALNVFAVDSTPLPEPSEPPPPPPSEPPSARDALLTSNVNYGLPMADDDFERSE
jgi:hypothetical protein